MAVIAVAIEAAAQAQRVTMDAHLDATSPKEIPELRRRKMRM